MNITKDYFEKQFKKQDKVTVYAQDNIPLIISKAPCIHRDDVRLEFEMDCADLADYCNLAGLSIKPNNTRIFCVTFTTVGFLPGR